MRVLTPAISVILTIAVAVVAYGRFFTENPIWSDMIAPLSLAITVFFGASKAFEVKRLKEENERLKR